ncbi:DUF2283 domain-containing protein [Thermodesulfovibrio sp.]|uniref:DUF2283 domain-containing protein n=1 Tax=Thermodesulfovibrio sp. TaxID=2067987 RepID=UPI0030AEC291
MKVEYDRDVDAIYIQILSEPVVESEEVAPDIIVDFTSDSKVAGIEILNASKRVEIMESIKSLLELNTPSSLSV